MSEDNKPEIIDITPKKPAETFEEKAERLLSRDDWRDLKKYIKEKNLPIAPVTVASFFELYISGSDIHEIYRLNPSFDKQALNWARIQYNWDFEKEKAISDLQTQIYDKVVKAQAELVDLLTTMTTVAHKKNIYKYKKYLQTGNDKELKGAVDATSLNAILRIVDGLQKITGADRTMKTENENTFNLNINKGADQTKGAKQLIVSQGGSDQGEDQGDLDSEDAAAILNALANSTRKKTKI